MKKNKTLEFILKLILIIIMLMPPLFFTAKAYSFANNQNVTNWYNKKRFEDFYSLEENSLNIAFLGSSHSYCTFDPEIFDEQLQTNSHQFGMPLQHIDMSYYTLREILNYQKPDTVVLELYFDMIDDDYVNEPVNDLIAVLQNDELIAEINNNARPLSERTKQVLPFVKNQNAFLSYSNKQLMNNLKEKGFEKESIVLEGTEYYKGKGYVYANYIISPSEYDETNQFKNFDGTDYVISKKQKDYIYKIYDLTYDNDIQLIFVTAPLANVSLDYIQNYNVVHNIFNEIANELNIPYYDYNLINLNLKNEHFRDDAHLNDSGVQIVSNDLIKKLNSNYSK